MGMTAGLFRRIAPALTVYSGRPRIDPQVAPAEALLALPTMDAAKVASVIAARAESTIGPAGNQPLPTGSPLQSLQLIGRAYTVHVELQRPSPLPSLSRVLETEGDVSAHAVVIRLIDDPIKPYWVLSRKLSEPPARSSRILRSVTTSRIRYLHLGSILATYGINLAHEGRFMRRSLNGERGRGVPDAVSNHAGEVRETRSSG
jgi:hypothetical protein